MTSDQVAEGDGCYGSGRLAVTEAADTLAANLGDTGVLDGLSWRLRISVRRRTVGLTIERDASVTIAVPAGSELGQLVPVLRARRPWIIRRTAERAQKLGEHPAKQIVSGEDFPYLGRNQRLLILPEQAVSVRRMGGRLCLPAMPARDGARAIVDWYTRAARAWMGPRIESWAGRVGVSPTGAHICDLGRRWGMAKSDGEVVLHWALFQLRPTLVDYVLVHELVHLAEPRHDAAFWQRLDLVLPDYEERRKRLAEAGRRVWLGDIEQE
jgi:predicted metal-dependent hydrolase